MNKNPYDVLGVRSDATDDEIKDAYRALAKKYHPDKYIDEDLKAIANEKMQEINEAYDTIKAMRDGSKNAYGTGYGTGAYGNAGGQSGSAYAAIRQMINAGQFSQAEEALNAVQDYERSAEWNYLYGCILFGRGWYQDAAKYFDTACRQDPYNPEYRAARLRLERMSQSYTQDGTNLCGGSGCEICQGLLCADCCCECLGGDLIRCC